MSNVSTKPIDGLNTTISASRKNEFKPSYVVTGSIEDAVYIGRHAKCTYQISADSKRISRNHCIIRFDKVAKIFLLKVVGVNGIKYHGKTYKKNDIIKLKNEGIIDCVGIKILFKEPNILCEDEILPIFSPSSKSSDSDLNIKVDELPPLNSPKKTFSSDSFDNISVGKEVLEVKNKDNNYDVNHGLITPLSHPLNLKDNQVTQHSPTFKKPVVIVEAKSEILTNHGLVTPTSNILKSRERSYSITKLAEASMILKKPHTKSSSIDASTDSTLKKHSHKRNNSSKIDSFKLKKVTKETCSQQDELLIDLILQTFAEMDKRTPISIVDLHSELSNVYPESSFTIDYVKQRLDRFPMFTEVPHTVPSPSHLKDSAYYYYIPEKDWNQNRRIEIGTLIRKPRECTLSSKQYYFKPPPKLPKYSNSKVRKS